VLLRGGGSRKDGDQNSKCGKQKCSGGIRHRIFLCSGDKCSGIKLSE
jgi:hypothetical protein